MTMTYNCECEKCKKNTKVSVNSNSNVFITAYGYLNIKCSFCGGDAFAKWHGFDGKLTSAINL